MIRSRLENSSKIKGYTMIEMLIVVALLGILIALALPDLSDTVESANTNSQIKVMLTTLNLARSEAIKRGDNVAICASDDGADCDADTWSDGWIIFHDANGDANGDTGSIDVGDTVIRVYDSLGADSTMTFTVDLFEYNSLGFSDTGGTQTFLLCPASGNANNARSIVVGPSGRGRRVEDGLACP